MLDFVFTSLPSRVIFSPGSLSKVKAEVELLGCKRAIVLSTPQQRNQADVVAELLGPLCVGIYDGAEMHVPIEGARTARKYASVLNADCAVAIGGGSTIGLGKAIALESSLPIIAIPTTYAGSEMTPIYGITEAGIKKTGKDIRVLPRVVIYDSELSSTLPLGMSLVSGFNAIAHAAEGIYSREGNPVMSLMAEEGIRALVNGMRGIKESNSDVEARTNCLYGAWLCGSVLGHVGMAIHHKLCHTLGGTLNLPHAETHTIILPHALAYNSDAVPDAMSKVARAVGADNAYQGLHQLAKDLGVPTALKDIGVAEEDLDRVCDIALANPYWNPRPVERGPLRELLQRAWAGDMPQP